MRIKKFSILHRNSIREKTFEFDDSVVCFFSAENSMGKTTFLRGLLYSLGFQIPSTKKVNFEQYTFTTVVISENGTETEIKRNCDLITIDGVDFNCQTDFEAIVGRVFGLKNFDLVWNFLATIYIDQDKGWSLLNRGKVIGSNAFSIESFLRGLNDKNVTQLQAKLKLIDADIERYSLMLNVADYQKAIESRQEEIGAITFDKEAEAEIGILQWKIDRLGKEIRSLSTTISQNATLVDYITRLGLQVRIEGKDYFVNKNNLLGFGDVQSINNLRLARLKKEKNALEAKKAELVERLSPKGLFEEPSIADAFDQIIARNKIDPILVESTLNSLRRDKEALRADITKATTEGNAWVTRLNSYLKQYWEEMGVELEYKDSYLLTRDLKSLSGALFYKIVAAFKLAYMRVLRQKTNVLFPIFVDSPSGREVKTETVERALALLKRDFAEHQIFLSSIVDYGHIFHFNHNSRIVFDNLRAFDPIMLFE